jgi:hypothetical protein
MFRLFLRKKILDGGKTPKRSAKDEGTAPPPPRRNRRIFDRFNVDHKHLTLMNEQDILLVREISAKGFSTEVSRRGYERLTVGDVYDARVRYLGEVYALQARVAWKRGSYVGFEIIKAGRDTLQFIKRLLRPIEIAASLKQVEATFLASGDAAPATGKKGKGAAAPKATEASPTMAAGKAWYHGDEESDLYTWHDPETGELKAWQLAIGEQYVEWRGDGGLATGALRGVQGREALMGANLQGLTHQVDARIDPSKKQLAIDVVMALPHTVRDSILETLMTG